MAQFQQIIQQLNNFQNFGIQVAPPPPIPQLNQVWQWNLKDGMPIFDQLLPQWERFVPLTMIEDDFLWTEVGQAFFHGMLDDEQIFVVDCTLNGGRTYKVKQRLLGLILQADIKKIHVVEVGNSLRFTKTNVNLMPFDDPPLQPGEYDQCALRTTPINVVGWKTPTVFITEINLNSQRGFYGPGSYQCREPHCLNEDTGVTGACMSQSPSVRYGPAPHQIIHLRKRFTCGANNVVYLLYCKACLASGLWTTYIGESEKTDRNLHNRFGGHCYKLVDQTNETRYPRAALAATIVERLNGDAPDPDRLLQDPFVHFNFVHSPQDRGYAILDGGFISTLNRKYCETLYKFIYGNFEYFPATFSGALNKNY